MYHKLWFASIALMFHIICTAQTKDTLSGNEQNLLRIAGNLIKTGMKETMKENKTGDKSKSVVGNAIKEIIGTTARKSAEQITQGGLNMGSLFQLPDMVKNKRQVFASKGKEMILNNAEQALQQAARNALNNAMWNMVEKAVDFNVDDLVQFANSDSLQITDVFKGAKRSALINTTKPIVKLALKGAGYKKKYKKLRKAWRKVDGDNLELDADNLLSEKLVDTFLDEMKNQEQQIKRNPLQLLDGLLKNSGLLNLLKEQ
jgi:Icc-related predicted phosphoesterase